MNKNNWNKVILVLLAFCIACAVMPVSLAETKENEETETIEIEVTLEESENFLQSVLGDAETLEEKPEQTEQEENIVTTKAAPVIPAYTGSEENPHPITNKYELASIGNADFGRRYPLDGYYIQTQDIVFTEEDFQPGGDFYNDGMGWLPIGPQQPLTTTGIFTGVYDGGNHAIKNIYINRPDDVIGVGIFGHGEGKKTKIKNLGNEDGFIIGNAFTGGIIGYQALEVNNCYNTGYVEGNGVIPRVGGVIGCATYVGGSNTAITNCFNTGEVNGLGAGPTVGGIIGQSDGGTITNCFNFGTVDGIGTSGGIFGQSSRTTIRNTYNRGKVGGARYVAGIGGSTSQYTSVIAASYNAEYIYADNPDNLANIMGASSRTGAVNSGCYFDREVTGNNYSVGTLTTGSMNSLGMTGLVAVENMPGLNSFDAFEAYEHGYPELKAFKYHEKLFVRELSQRSVHVGEWTDPNPEPIPATGISLNKTEFTLNVNEEFQLAATVVPDNATNKNVAWSSSDDSIAMVDNNGKVTGISEGEAIITVTTEDGGHTASCKVTVTAEEPVDLPITEDVVINDIVTGTGNNEIEYVGDWAHADQGRPNAYEEDEHYTNTADDYFQVRFNGTGITWYGAKANDLAVAAVYIDDEFVKYIDCYSENREDEVALFQSGELPIGQHVLKVVLTNYRHQNSLGQYITVDKIEIKAQGAPKDTETITINDTDEGSELEQIAYTGSWNYTSPKEGSYQDDDHATREIGASFEVKFKGTTLKWFGMKASNCGMAAIYLDGELIETVDCYDAERLMQQLLFDSGSLSDGEHTLKVVVSGERNPASSNNYIILDKLEITQ